MSVMKDKERNTWRVFIRYVDWQGKKQRHTKRGFKTKREALEYEREFLLMKSKNLNMPFSRFVEIYLEDIKHQIKKSTLVGKRYMIDKKIMPYFGEKAIQDIDTTDIIQWQNELLSMRDENDKPYSQTYLRTIQNQLNAILNHAHRYYKLVDNPAFKVKKMGKSNANEMQFWTKEEYLKFSEAIKDKPLSFYSFEVLFWTGIRAGELMALTKADFDLENRKLNIDKSYTVVEGEEMITDPKTEQSVRIIDLPEFLCEEMEDYFGMLYRYDDNARIFDVSKSYLHHEMDRGAKAAGVKRIRVHDIRHSHCAMCLELGFSTVEIAKRLGHKGVSITYMYSHIYPNKHSELADRLNQNRRNLVEEKKDE